MGDILDEYDATGLSELVARGDVTAVELVEASIARIDALEPKLNAVIHRQFDRARRDGDLLKRQWLGGNSRRSECQQQAKARQRFSAT